MTRSLTQTPEISRQDGYNALSGTIVSKSKRLHRIVMAFCLLLCVPVCADAQIGDTGQIQGTAIDPTGAIVPGAEVTATETSTNRISKTVTNKDGFYAFPSLRVGHYEVKVEKQGFQTTVHSGITLQVQQVAVVDMKMMVGQVAETVQVTGEPPLLETQTSGQGQVIEAKQIVDLPLNGRDYAQLALLSQGAVQPLASARAGGFSTGGQRTTQNNYLLNGMDNNDMEIAWQGRQAEVVKPIIDAIQEFKVQTNGYQAEFGRATGGVLNLTTKSGTNKFHGVLWEFLRNDKMDAREYFNSYPDAKAPFKRNQFGGAIGGPIVRDRLFFFQALEWQRRHESLTVLSTLPTEKERTGDFSEIFPKIIYNPDTYNSATNSRTAYANNQITNIDPVSQKMIDLIPHPNKPGLANNYTFTRPNGFDSTNSDSRVDFTASARDNLAWTFDYQSESDPRLNSFPGPMGGGGQRDITGQATSLQWSHVFSPNWFVSTRLGWNRRYTASGTGYDENFNSQIGLTGVSLTVPTLAHFSISGYNIPGGPLTTPNLSGSQNRQWVTDFSWLRGKHQIKFGANFEFLEASLSNPQSSIGSFTFNGKFTNNPSLPTASAGGNTLADFMVGIPSSTTVSNPVLINLRSQMDAFYVQDTWRILQRLTVDFGLRYEVFRPWVDKANKLVNVDLPVSGSQVSLRLADPKNGRSGRALMATDLDNVAPRLGFALDVGHQTVIRGFGGLFYGNFEPTGGGSFLETNPPYQLSASIATDGITPALTLAGGVPDVLTPSNLTSPNLSYFPTQITMPYSYQYNLNIQHTFGQNWFVQVGYFGTMAHHLLKIFDLNQPIPGPGNINARRPYKSFIFPGTGTIITPLAGFNAQNFSGNANYNSAQAKLEKRLSHGFTILSSYIFSRSISDICGPGDGTFAGQAPGCGIQNIYNQRVEHSLDNQHVKHRFVASYIYQLPFGHNRAFGNHWNRGVDALLGGWSTDGILTLTSGVPYSITTGSTDPANVGTFNAVQRPNLVGNPKPPAGANPVTEFFNTAAFAVPAQYTFGNLGRNTMIGPSYKNWDVGLYKDTKLFRATDLQFRAEAFNITNTPQFGTPANTVGAAAFGQISTIVGNSRKLQFGLKLMF